MNDEAWKKGFLLLVCAIVILTYMTVDNDTIEVKVKDDTALNESTCTNAFNSLKAAKFQQWMLDRQVLLSTAAGRAAEAATAAAQVSELNVVITVLKELIADPKLSCDMYLENTVDK